jgi:hypothetical protein
MSPRRREIEAAIAAHNDADQESWLPPEAAHLLSVMFPCGHVCQRNLDSLVLEGRGRRVLLRLLEYLGEAGFLTKQRGAGRVPNVYRLHLPPQARP